MKNKCTEDRQETAILVGKVRTGSLRYTKGRMIMLSKVCRNLGKMNL